MSLSKKRWMSHAYAVSHSNGPLGALPTAHIQAATGHIASGSVASILSLGFRHD
jgi:hypothetical protein